MHTLLPLLTIGLPWLGAACIWLIGDRRPQVLRALSIVFSVAAGIAALGMIPYASADVVLSLPMGSSFGNFTLVADGLGILIAVIASVVGSLAIIFALDYMKHGHQLARFYALVLFFIGTMSGLGLSGSLLLTFLLWEITALCSYALISFHNDDPKAVAGGVKALIMTQVGGVGLLAGALLAYAYLGDYSISNFLAQADTLPAGVLAAIGFSFLAAAIAKSAQVPLHSWLPDAMEAPTPVTALIHAATMVNAGVYLLARFYPAFADVPGWSMSVILVGALTALLAGLMAVAANDIKRVLAYSTISQLGYMVYAVGCGAIFASQFHLLSHAIFKALLFLAAGAIITAIDTRNLQQMGGLGKKMPFVRLAFSIGSLGLVGLPIANGFFSKELILEEGLAHSPLPLYLVMLAGAGITALYTLRLNWLIFAGQPRGPEPQHDALPAMRVSLAILSLGTLTSWLLAGGLGSLFAETLPFHHIEADSTLTVAGHIVTAPATWIAITVLLLGGALWFTRSKLGASVRIFEPVLTHDFGFEWLQNQVSRLVQGSAALLQHTQTGQVNWNVAGILLGLLAILILLLRGIAA